jgi:hypothetical protein
MPLQPGGEEGGSGWGRSAQEFSSDRKDVPGSSEAKSLNSCFIPSVAVSLWNLNQMLFERVVYAIRFPFHLGTSAAPAHFGDRRENHNPHPLLLISIRSAYVTEHAVVSPSILPCFVPLLIGLFHKNRRSGISGVATLLGSSAAAPLPKALKVPVSPIQ